MIKRPFLWGIGVFVGGILLAWYKVPLIYMVLLVLGGWLIVYLLMCCFKKYINSKDSFLWVLPILMLVGFIAMKDQMKLPDMEMAFDEKAECSLIGEVTMIVKKPWGMAYYLKDNVVDLLDGSTYRVEEVIVNIYTQEYGENQNSRKSKESKKSKESQKPKKLHKSEEYQIGNIVNISGTIKKISVNTNPGGFNEQLYYKIQNISYKVNAKEMALVDADYSKFHSVLNSIKEELIDVYNNILSEKEAGTIIAMVLGEKYLLGDEIKTLYQESGISHILAISGLHISMIGAAIYFLLRKLRLGLYMSTILSMVFVYSYGILTNFSVSTNRAVVMYSVMLIANLIGKTFDILSALSFSAFIILIQNPMELFQAGFILSFCAVLGIALILPCLNSLYEAKSVVLKGIYVSVSAQLFTLPFVLYFFFQIPIYSVFTNLIILPFTSILMFTALGAGLAGIVSVSLGVFIAGGVNYILKFYEIICRLADKLPSNLITVGRPNTIKIITYLVVILVFIISARRYEKKWLMILIIAAVGILLVSGPRNNLSITMLDVGQGEAIYMESKKGTTFLIDGGSSDIAAVGIYRIKPFLLSKGVDRIDYAIVTHEDKDHISGLMELMAEGKVKIINLVLPRIDKSGNTLSIDIIDNYSSLEALAKEGNINIMYIKAGDYIREGNLSITCLHPSEGYSYASANDYSTVLSVSYGEFDMLLTGDVGLDGERIVVDRILKYNYVDEKLADSGYDVLKCAHHGSKNSTSNEMLSVIKPGLSLISCGKNNRYGHPHEELLDRVDDVGSEVVKTYESGAITIKTDGKRMSVEKYME